MSVYEGFRERLGKHHQPPEKLSGCHRVYQKCRTAEIELSGIIALTGKMGDWTGGEMLKQEMALPVLGNSLTY